MNSTNILNSNRKVIVLWYLQIFSLKIEKDKNFKKWKK